MTLEGIDNVLKEIDYLADTIGTTIDIDAVHDKKPGNQDFNLIEDEAPLLAKHFGHRNFMPWASASVSTTI